MVSRDQSAYIPVDANGAVSGGESFDIDIDGDFCGKKVDKVEPNSPSMKTAVQRSPSKPAVQDSALKPAIQYKKPSTYKKNYAKKV